MKVIIGCSLIILFLNIIPLKGQQIHKYTVYKTDSELAIDGKLDEQAWKAAPSTERFVDYVTGDLLSLSTRAKMLWDSTCWYFGFTCEDPDVWGTMTERDDWLWEGEVVEIFADPDGDGKNYFEGTTISVPPHNDDTYRTLVTRNDFERKDDQTVERTCWIQMNDWNPHIPERFGYTTFSDSTSLEYRDHLNEPVKAAGYRASRVMPSPFPPPLYWSRVGHKIADKFENATPGALWIVSTYWDNGDIGLHFPRPDNSTNYPHINFSWDDKNEAFLDEFDATGVKVWLQVESGDADVETLIKLILDRYHHHPCVLGFGVDVEWYHNNSTYYFGRAVTDEEAESWEKQVKSYNNGYTLFLKHFISSYMPPDYRGDIIFVNDSQDFPNLQSMVNEFSAWGVKFKDNFVGFQFGYDFDTNGDRRTDKTWWNTLDDPVKTIGEKLFTTIENCTGIFWVDFTIKEIYPVDSITETGLNTDKLSREYHLCQNYPNPFNPETTIQFTLRKSTHIALKIFDVLGQEVRTLVEGTYTAGIHVLYWDGCDKNGNEVSGGVYLYQLRTNDFTQNKKCVLVK